MADHHARSVLAALTLGAAVTLSGCAGGSATSSSSDSPASVDGADRGPAPPSEPAGRDVESGKPGATGGSGDPGSRPQWCSTEALSVSLAPGQPAAGNRYAALVLTNSSPSACRTQGWPGLQLTGEAGEKIPTEVVRDRSVPSRPLTLSPGGKASARLHWTVVPGEGDPSDGRCPDPRAVRVIPPDEHTAKAADWRLGEVCGAGELDVRPLLPGAGPPR